MGHDNSKKELLESAVFKLFQEQAFYAAMLQEINISYSNFVPSAGISYNKKQQKFNIYLNFEYLEKLTVLERSAVLYHEILHFAHGHLMRFASKDKVTKIENIAADMSINQYIKNLPEGTIDVKKFKMKDGSDFPTFRTYEEYIKLLEESVSPQHGGKQENNKQATNDPEMEKYKEFDIHDWEKLSEEEKEALLEESQKLIKRTIEKTSNSFTQLPDHLKDLLEKIEVELNKLNYKALLANAVKKTIAISDRSHTWNRPSKRYGIYSPGTKVGETPSLGIFVDTSGSISHTEINEFLQFISNLLKVGAKRCDLGLWHTDLYKVKPFKLNQKITEDDVESGGTDPNKVLDYIVKHKYDLSLILTDGYFDGSYGKIKQLGSNLIWVISKNGNKEHPYFNKVGKTVKLS